MLAIEEEGEVGTLMAALGAEIGGEALSGMMKGGGSRTPAKVEKEVILGLLMEGGICRRNSNGYKVGWV